MKTLFYFIVAAIAIGVLLIYTTLNYAGSMLGETGKSYVNGNIHAIIDNWSASDLKQRESDEFRAATSDTDLSAIFTQYSKLGTLKNYSGCSGQAVVETTQSGLRTTATYAASATFANGAAEIKISLIQIKGEWQILGFRVSSPIFEQ